MIRSNPEQILEPRAEETLEVVGQDGEVQSETVMLKRAKEKEGMSPLNVTLTLIEKELKGRTNGAMIKSILDKLNENDAQKAAIRQELIKNCNENLGDDQREKIAARIAGELIDQANRELMKQSL